MNVGAIVCAWCKAPIHAGDPSKPISHGICPSCKEQLEQEVA